MRTAFSGIAGIPISDFQEQGKRNVDNSAAAAPQGAGLPSAFGGNDTSTSSRWIRFE